MTDLIEKISVKLLSKRGFISENVRVSPITTLDLKSYDVPMHHDVYQIVLKIGAEVPVADLIDLERIKGHLIDAIKHEMYKDIQEITHYAITAVIEDNQKEALVHLDKLMRMIS